jgi:hypothetical protein
MMGRVDEGFGFGQSSWKRLEEGNFLLCIHAVV